MSLGGFPNFTYNVMVTRCSIKLSVFHFKKEESKFTTANLKYILMTWEPSLPNILKLRTLMSKSAFDENIKNYKQVSKPNYLMGYFTLMVCSVFCVHISPFLNFKITHIPCKG